VLVRSGLDGIVVANEPFLVSADNTVNNNLVDSSGGHGLRFEGTGHTVFRNVAKNSAADGCTAPDSLDTELMVTASDWPSWGIAR
jgi:hypothetical protein